MLVSRGGPHGAALAVFLLVVATRASPSKATFLPVDRQVAAALGTPARRHLLESNCGDFAVCSGQAMPSAVLDNNPAECLYDVDFKMWMCGDYVMTQEMYDSVQSQTCVSDCSFEETLVSAEGIEDGYYWQTSEWGPCSASCGGGTQQRSVQCRQSEDNVLVANDNCQALKPPVLQACNQVPCELQSLSFTEVISEATACSAACGSGWQEQPLLCALDDGYLAPISFCSSAVDTPSPLLCNTQLCQGIRWEVGPWSECSAPCNGGFMTRSVTCLGEDNTPVGLDQCEGGMPAALPCNVNPCEPSAWTFGSFEACVPDNGECGPGVQSRGYPWCRDSSGSFSGACDFPGPTNEMPCLSDTPCEACAHDCFGRGQCVSGQCSCGPGWRGQFCEMSIDTCPQGVLDQSGACCATGVVDQDGSCCPDPLASLDASGNCCSSGKLDASGTCNGLAKFVDIGGTACEGLLDAAGTCCESGLVDECGVCKGYGQSCAMQATVVMIRDHQSSAAPPANYVFTSFMAAVLGVKASQVKLDSVEHYFKSTLGVPEEGYRVQMTVAPAVDGTLMVTTGGAALRLNSQQGSKSPTGSVFLGEAVHLLRMPICGNSICEIGERVLQGSSSADAMGCPEDCGHGYSPCPVTEGVNGAVMCGGRGKCYTVPGECLCFEGHYGTACEKCQPGWVKYGGICVFQTDTAGTAQGTLVASLASILLSVAAGAVVSVAVIAGYTLIVRHRKRSKVRPDDCQETPFAHAGGGQSDGSYSMEQRTPTAGGSNCGAAIYAVQGSGMSARALDTIIHQPSPFLNSESGQVVLAPGLGSPLSGVSSRRLKEALAPLAAESREPSGRRVRTASSTESPLAGNSFSLRKDVLKQKQLKENEPQPTISTLRNMMEHASSMPSPPLSPHSPTAASKTMPHFTSTRSSSGELSPIIKGERSGRASAAGAGKSPLSKPSARRSRSSEHLGTFSPPGHHGLSGPVASPPKPAESEGMSPGASGSRERPEEDILESVSTETARLRSMSTS